MIEVVMFTGNNCGKCKGAKFNLSNLPPHIKENLKLIERNVDVDQMAKRILTEKMGVNTLPTFVINGDYEKPLIGFEENMGKIMGVLGL
ncbi:redoxin [Bacillus phage vB_BceP_LY3]|uniref:Redoxin n=1 Tax=Bacillus phage vB_BceP_LY3 TaxID=2950458 RepID=A0A9Y1CVQ4_9CAUD|nr:redoxin [Bacillus phage vB_BceP_LY3]